MLGDGTSCLHNYCMKKYTRGVYTVNGTASNDFYQASKQMTIVSCPNSAVSVTYPAEISVMENSIKYNGIFLNISLDLFSLLLITPILRV